MYTNKFKNTGSFATSAMVSAFVLGVHAVGLQLLLVDNANSAPSAAPQEQTVMATNVEAKRVEMIEPIIVTASRL